MPSCHACIKSKNWKSFRPLSLEYTSDTDEGWWWRGGGECIGWPNTWNRLHLDEWNFVFFRWGDKRKRRNLKWKGLGFFFFQCVLVSKKPGRSRCNTHFLIAVVMTDYDGWNLMTDGSLMSIRNIQSRNSLGFVPHSKSGSVIVFINRHVLRLPDEIIATIITKCVCGSLF